MAYTNPPRHSRGSQPRRPTRKQAWEQANKEIGAQLKREGKHLPEDKVDAMIEARTQEILRGQ